MLESVADLAAEGFEPVVLPVERDGRLDPDRLRDALQLPTLLVTVMAVNNETGVIQDIPGARGHRAGGRRPVPHRRRAGRRQDPGQRGRDRPALISGHKLYGPKGVGALYVRRRPRVRLQPLFSGGGQERGLRSGTLPAPLVVGLGEACRIAARRDGGGDGRIAALRQRLLDRLRVPVDRERVLGTPDRRQPEPHLPRAAALEMMRAVPDLCVSTGSACSSAEIEPSYVLRALGLDDAAAARTLRIGLGRFTSAADVDFAADALSEAAPCCTGPCRSRQPRCRR